MLHKLEWVANCSGCGQEGKYFVKNRLNPRGRRHTSHFPDEDTTVKACGQFKRKPRLLPFRVPASFFPDAGDEGGSISRKGSRMVDTLSVGMFVVFTGNDEEERVARVILILSPCNILTFFSSFH